jgi:hypothetical protein
MVAWDQKGWVETPLGSDFFPLQYRVDKAKQPSKVDATPRPAQPVQPLAPASKSMGLPKGVDIWDRRTGSVYYKAYPPLPQQTKPASMNDPVPHQELYEEVKKLGLQVAKLLSSREADQKLAVPDEANTLLRRELAAAKEENGKLKEDQLRAAAAAEAAEATRLAQLAAQSQEHSVQIEKLEQAQAELKARLEETITQMKAKNAEITRLVNQREAAAQEYCTPQKDYSEYDFENYNESDFEDAKEAKRAQRIYLTELFRQDDERQKSKKKSKHKVNLHKRQGATSSKHQAR